MASIPCPSDPQSTPSIFADPPFVGSEVFPSKPSPSRTNERGVFLFSAVTKTYDDSSEFICDKLACGNFELLSGQPGGIGQEILNDSFFVLWSDIPNLPISIRHEDPFISSLPRILFPSDPQAPVCHPRDIVMWFLMLRMPLPPPLIFLTTSGASVRSASANCGLFFPLPGIRCLISDGSVLNIHRCVRRKSLA
jgi:hypothetical protein